MKKTLSFRLLLKVILFILLLLVSGCVTTSGNFIKIRPDKNVTQAFESLTVIPGYNYYYYGSISFPKAFVGISKDYTLDSAFWKPIDLTSKDLRNWIWGRAERPTVNSKRYGSNIIGPDGGKIGVWYSLEDSLQWARIILKDNKLITIGMPIDYNKVPTQRFFRHDD